MRSFSLLALLPVFAFAQSSDRWEVRLESGAVWIPKSDIRRFGTTGTTYSVPGLGGDGPYVHGRVTAYYRVGRGQRVRFLYAPLDVTTTGTLASPTVFEDATFGPGIAQARYRFTNYRASYLWPLVNRGRLTSEYGVTLFVRDAKIALGQQGLSRSFSNVGVVPLLHLGARYDAGRGFSGILDLDALEAPQGRVYDLGLQAAYRLTRNAEATLGVRYLSGGVANDDIFNSAVFSYVTAGINFRF